MSRSGCTHHHHRARNPRRTSAKATRVLGFLNSDDNTERYLGYVGLIALKYGLARLYRAINGTADDYTSAAIGCGAAGWNGYQLTTN